MTGQALVGLSLLNALFLGVGIAALWAIRGWRSWSEVAALAGLAYMLGVAAMGITLTLELVLGVPFSLAAVILTGAGLVLASAAARRLLARWRPLPAEARIRGLGVVAAAFAALVLVYLEALFRPDEPSVELR